MLFHKLSQVSETLGGVDSLHVTADGAERRRRGGGSEAAKKEARFLNGYIGARRTGARSPGWTKEA
jgi:hypothetical protein